MGIWRDSPHHLRTRFLSEEKVALRGVLVENSRSRPAPAQSLAAAADGQDLLQVAPGQNFKGTGRNQPSDQVKVAGSW
ncbi:hypothetical protein OC845_003794 [Tilletia horrida]|nr:hypothetical protein OC845_003794 [Tilletia horrida]